MSARIEVAITLFGEDGQKVTCDHWSLDIEPGEQRLDAGHPAYLAWENAISDGMQAAEALPTGRSTRDE